MTKVWSTWRGLRSPYTDPTIWHSRILLFNSGWLHIETGTSWAQSGWLAKANLKRGEWNPNQSLKERRVWRHAKRKWKPSWRSWTSRMQGQSKQSLIWMGLWGGGQEVERVTSHRLKYLKRWSSKKTFWRIGRDPWRKGTAFSDTMQRSHQKIARICWRRPCWCTVGEDKYVSSVQCIIDAVESFEQRCADENSRVRRSVVFLGHNGNGKSFLINLGLQVRESLVHLPRQF